jgi:hypothetical protein
MLKDSPNGLSFLTHLLLSPGANIAGFVKIANAMVAQGLV